MSETARAADKLEVFISYSREDLDFADQLDIALSGTGFKVTVDRHGISGAEEWKRRLAELIREADTVVFALSPSSARSDVCAWEVEEAARLGKRIIPVLCQPLGDAAPPARLSELNYIYFCREPKMPQSGFGSGLMKLIAALREDPEWLREHTRLLGLAVSWQTAGRPAGRLLSGDDIGRAKKWLTERRQTKTEPTALHLEFIRASEEEASARDNQRRRDLKERERLLKSAEVALADKQAAQQREAAASRRVLHRTVMGLVAAIALALTASGLGYMAYQKQIEAESEKITAELQRKEATRYRDESLQRQSLFLTDRAAELAKSGAASTGLLLALEAMPDTSSDDEVHRSRPYVAEAERALAATRQQLRERPALEGSDKSAFLVLSPDGKRLFASRGDDIDIWDTTSWTRQATLKEHTETVHTLAISGDGRMLVTSGLKAHPRVWERGSPSADAPEGWRVTAVLGGYDVGIFGAVASIAQNGSRIVTGATDGRVRIWEPAGGGPGETAQSWQSVAVLDPNADWVAAVAISSDGSRIASGSMDGPINVWERSAQGHRGDWRTVRKLSGHKGLVMGLAMSPDGKRLASGANDGQVRIWDLGDADPDRWRSLAAHDGYAEYVGRVAFSAKADQVIGGGAKGAMRIWSADTGAELRVVRSRDVEIYSAVDLRDGAHIATASPETGIKLWDMRDTPGVSALGAGGAARLAFSPQGDHLVTATEEGALAIWDTRTSTRIGEMRSAGKEAWALSASPRGHQLVIGAPDGTIRTFDLDTSSETSRILATPNDLRQIKPVCESRLILAVTNDHLVRVIDTANGSVRTVLAGHRDAVTRVEMNKTCDRVVTTSTDRTLRLWNVATAKAMAVVADVSAEAEFTMTENGKHLLIWSKDDKTAKLWNLEDGSEGAVLQEFDPQSLIQIATDSSHIIAYQPSWLSRSDSSSAGSGIIRVWSVADGKLKFSLGERSNPPTAVAVADTSAYLAAGYNDGTVVLWSLATGAELTRLTGHTAVILSILIAPGGLRLVTTSEDGSTRLWNSSSGAEISKLVSPRPGTREETSTNESYFATSDGSRIIGRQWNASSRTSYRYRSQVLRSWNALDGDGPIEIGNAVRSVDWASDGDVILAGWADNTVTLWDARTGSQIAVLKESANELTSKSLSKDRSRLVTGRKDGSVRIWDVASGGELRVLKGHARPVSSIWLSPDGSRIITQSTSDGVTKVWHGAEGSEVLALRAPPKDIVSFAVTPDGAAVVTGTRSGIVEIIDIAAGTRRASFDALTDGPVRAVAAPDGTRLLTYAHPDRSTGEDDETWSEVVRLWDAKSPARPIALKGNTSRVSASSFSTDSSRFVTGETDGTVRIWDAGSGVMKAALKGHTTSITSAVFSKDGKLVLTASTSGASRVWEGETGALLRIFNPPPERDDRRNRTFRGRAAKDFAMFSTDEKRVLASQGGLLNIWSIDKAVLLAQIGDAGGAVAVSPRDDRIATSSEEAVRLWTALPDGQALVEQVKSMAPRCLTSKERDAFRLSPVTPAWCVTLAKPPYDPEGVYGEIAGLLNKQLDDQARRIIALLERRDSGSGKRVEQLWARAYVDRGGKMLTDGKPADARAQFALARQRRIEPDVRAKTLHDIAWQWLIHEKAQEGLADAMQAVDLAPETFSYLDTRGQIYAALGRAQEGLADLDRAIENGTQSIATYFSRGLCHEQLSNIDAARADYLKAAEASTRDDYDRRLQRKARLRLTELGGRGPANGAQ